MGTSTAQNRYGQSQLGPCPSRGGAQFQNLQTPWGTDVHMQASSHGVAGRGGSRGGNMPLGGGVPAGMPSRGDGSRSSSVPSGRGDSRGGASRRYESPLSHIGQRLLLG